jgi:hypothetical protein
MKRLKLAKLALSITPIPSMPKVGLEKKGVKFFSVPSLKIQLNPLEIIQQEIIKEHENKQADWLGTSEQKEQ